MLKDWAWSLKQGKVGLPSHPIPVQSQGCCESRLSNGKREFLLLLVRIYFKRESVLPGPYPQNSPFFSTGSQWQTWNNPMNIALNKLFNEILGGILFVEGPNL